MISPERTVDSLESLFVACGWNSEEPPRPWVQRGVIVLDVDESAHRNLIMEAMKERKALCVDHSKRKAIWVLERNLRE